METFYGQNRRNYHTFRLSDEEELFVFAQMKKFGYHSISAFIRDAVLDEKLTVEICQDPVKYDYSRSIRQLITAIPVLDKRWARAEKEFVNACNIPGSHPPACLQGKTHRCRNGQQVGISDQVARRVARKEIVDSYFLSYDAIPL